MCDTSFNMLIKRVNIYGVIKFRKFKPREQI